jgi:AcrR family transcriptional regulator
MVRAVDINIRPTLNLELPQRSLALLRNTGMLPPDGGGNPLAAPRQAVQTDRRGGPRGGDRAPAVREPEFEVIELRSQYNTLEKPLEGEWPTRHAEECAVRYRQEHKQATRQRIIKTAGRRFKMDGIDGSGIAALMRDAGLTNGAFYTHFASKDDLVATTIAAQMQAQNASIVAHAEPGRAGLEQIVRWYLSPWHRDSRDTGCPSAALLDEIGRCTHLTKQAYTDGVLVVADGIAARLAPNDPLSVRTMALSAYAMMAGTLQLARALADPQLADQVLEQGIRNALALLGIEHGCATTPN